MSNKYRVLVVEDHKQLAENLFEYLGDEGYQLDYAGDGLTALHLLACSTYDVVILDIMLPGVNGLTICQRIRKDLQSSVPIIMLTARDGIEDKTLAFNRGADDYLVKPFLMKELELRVKSLTRRYQPLSTYLEVGKLRYDPSTLNVQWEGKADIKLSGYGATIIEVLVKKYPAFVTYQDLSFQVWNDEVVDPNTIRTHVYSLRKLFKETWDVELIKTVHGRGYALQSIT